MALSSEMFLSWVLLSLFSTRVLIKLFMALLFCLEVEIYWPQVLSHTWVSFLCSLMEEYVFLIQLYKQSSNFQQVKTNILVSILAVTFTFAPTWNWASKSIGSSLSHELKLELQFTQAEKDSSDSIKHFLNFWTTYLKHIIWKVNTCFYLIFLQDNQYAHHLHT